MFFYNIENSLSLFLGYNYIPSVFLIYWEEVGKSVYLYKPLFAVSPYEMVVRQDPTRLVATHLSTEVHTRTRSLQCLAINSCEEKGFFFFRGW